MATYSDPMGFKNYGFDQVIAGRGQINYCVRWDSNQKVPPHNASRSPLR